MSPIEYEKKLEKLVHELAVLFLSQPTNLDISKAVGLIYVNRMAAFERELEARFSDEVEKILDLRSKR